MEKNKLSSFLGDVSVFVAYCIGGIILSIFIYNVISLDFYGIYSLLFFLIFYYFAFGRKIIKFKKVYFDEKYIYTNKYGKVSLDKIKNINNKTIEFFVDGKLQIIYFNNYYISNNYYILKKYIENSGLKDV